MIHLLISGSRANCLNYTPVPETRILVVESEHFSLRAAEILRDLGPVHLGDLDEEELVREISWANVLWVRLRHKIHSSLMSCAQDLRIIVSATTGLDHIDVPEAERRGIRILSLRGESTFLEQVRATAEHTIGLTLSLLRKLPSAAQHVRTGGWRRELFWGNELHTKTVGVVGYGRLGRIVSRYFLTFGARVLVSDPLVPQREIEAAVQLVPLDYLLARADIVTLHVNLTPDTWGFWNRHRLASMKTGSWLINSSRGELIDESALLGALKTGHLGGAALDVLSNEDSGGMADSPLVQYARAHDNLLITPHIGGLTRESVEKTEHFLAERLRRLLSSCAE